MGPTLKSGAAGGGGDGDAVDNDSNDSLNVLCANKVPDTVLSALQAFCHLRFIDSPFLCKRKLRHRHLKQQSQVEVLSPAV